LPAEVKDYSQWGEQAAILKALGIGILNGGKYERDQDNHFLDIGAFASKALSNTRALYELGWSGVMVEPSPGPLTNLIRDYGNDDRIEIIGAAVGGVHGLTHFYATDDAVGTTEPGNFEKWKATGGFYGSFWCPVITIPEILNQFGSFDFVSIDTEGSSVFILQELLKTQMRPQCICVEHDGRILETTQMATAQGYKVVFATGDNLVLSL
jgi:FkbM family methyltransferase